MRGGGVGEHAEGHEPIARAAISAGQVVTDNAKVIAGDVRELRAARTVPHRPDAGRGSLQPLVDANISAGIQLDAAPLQSHPLRVSNAPRRDDNVAARD